MAGQKSRRRSRKRRNPSSPPRAVASSRRELPAEPDAHASGRPRRSQPPPDTAGQPRRGQRLHGTEGERPPSPFGVVPVSEIAIFAGLVALIVWLFTGAIATLIVGLVVCGLGVIEVTAREHFSGYRSHATLLAAIPAVAVGIGAVSAIGAHHDRAPLLLVIAGPVFGMLFWLLRRRFQTARQARVARPPAP